MTTISSMKRKTRRRPAEHALRDDELRRLIAQRTGRWPKDIDDPGEDVDLSEIVPNDPNLEDAA